MGIRHHHQQQINRTRPAEPPAERGKIVDNVKNTQMREFYKEFKPTIWERLKAFFRRAKP